MNLFAHLPNKINIEDGEIVLYESFYDGKKADLLFDKFLKEIKWNQDFINMYGKKIPLPRMTSWYGDPNATYSYSGINNQPNNWTETLSSIKKDIELKCENKFNSLLLNRYKNGKDKLSWHADDEPQLDPKCCIASLSLGSERFFSIKHKNKVDDKNSHYKKYNHKMLLNHGSLLIMKPPFQEFWLHQIPAMKNITTERINLTFRFVKINEN